jgi:four helix bundle protein
MDPDDFRKRTKAFALRVLRLTDELLGRKSAHAIARQLERIGPAVGANYRSACRAKSVADFVSKMGNVEEECDESIYWMELLADGRYVSARRLEPLIAEAREILAMVVASINTARRRPRK